MNRTRFISLLLPGISFILLIFNYTNSSAKETFTGKENPICINPINPDIPQPLIHITYKLIQAGHPNADELSAYKLIKQVMDSAIHYYNLYTSASQQITITYVTTKGVRADAGPNGKMRFGPERTYMNVGTAMHEISHTVGVGTTGKWKSFMHIDAPTGKVIFKGKNATNMLREITGDKNALIFMDNQHFWPYGLNYVREYKTKSDLINHCKIINAMIKDGL